MVTNRDDIESKVKMPIWHVAVLSASDCFHKASLGTTSIVKHLGLEYFFLLFLRYGYSNTADAHSLFRSFSGFFFLSRSLPSLSNRSNKITRILRILYSFQIHDGVIGACKAPCNYFISNQCIWLIDFSAYLYSMSASRLFQCTANIHIGT